ncbi:glucokinase [Labilibaculum manganireducens]|uniref:Glucokinase n=1 Tax=Labilibaculum manganireducens TaxID=1940525 RepID=A0A2N3HVN7_9BACT|nr:ROK family protein [Labilibaculum manganireducens]PKQ62130.1 glucokinase [Labilibaculum manganireducens]
MQKLAVGIDIGGTNTVFGLVDKKGNILAEDFIFTKKYLIFQAFIDELCDRIQSLAEKLNCELVGIGVGAPNANYLDQCIQNASNLPWKGKFELGKLLSQKIRVPVFVTNDANASAMAEMLFGGAVGMKNFMVLTLGTGLGSGIVVNGELVHGHSGLAGEMGHMIVRPEGRHCGCGRLGCLETYVSATGIKRTVSKLFAKFSYSSELRNIPFNRMSARRLASEAYSGDQIAIEAFEFTGKILGIALANVIALNNPEAIFLSGGLSKAGNLILKPTQYHMEQNLLSVFQEKTQLKLSSVEGNSGVLGSAALVWKVVE